MSTSLEGGSRGGVATGASLLFLELPEAEGGRVQISRYRGKRNLVLVFLDRPDCSPCRELLRQAAAARDEIAAEEAELLVMVRATRPEAAALKYELGLSWLVLYDEAGEAFQRYGAVAEDGAPRAAVFISDRFGEVYHTAVAGDDHGLPSLADILSWLRFIEVQCPECGAPEWPR